MRRHILTLLVLIFVGSAGATPARAGDAIRCGGDLVQSGDLEISVRRACGPPSFTDRWFGGGYTIYGVLPSMSEWVYNRGPGRLLQVIRFSNGRVQAIDSDGYGFTAGSPSMACQPDNIQQGMSKYRLLAMCGPPIQENAGFVNSTVIHEGAQDYYLSNAAIPTYREILIYNFGANRLLRQVMLENGQVVAVQTLDRGFDN